LFVGENLLRLQGLAKEKTRHCNNGKKEKPTFLPYFQRIAEMIFLQIVHAYRPIYKPSRNVSARGGEKKQKIKEGEKKEEKYNKKNARMSMPRG
jgi:hypothetical protein